MCMCIAHKLYDSECDCDRQVERTPGRWVGLYPLCTPAIRWVGHSYIQCPLVFLTVERLRERWHGRVHLWSAGDGTNQPSTSVKRLAWNCLESQSVCLTSSCIQNVIITALIPNCEKNIVAVGLKRKQHDFHDRSSACTSREVSASAMSCILCVCILNLRVPLIASFAVHNSRSEGVYVAR